MTAAKNNYFSKMIASTPITFFVATSIDIS
jgi:hypothetical protein